MNNITEHIALSRLYIVLLRLLQEGAIKVKDLSLPELIGIIDTCFCCLVSFAFI